jgi:hypothetical protein
MNFDKSTIPPIRAFVNKYLLQYPENDELKAINEHGGKKKPIIEYLKNNERNTSIYTPLQLSSNLSIRADALF